MKLNNEKEVKKWLRNLAVIKKELELKIDFYRELERDFDGKESLRKHREEYMKKIKELKNTLNKQIADIERLFSNLTEEERMILTARYINLVKWDYIEFRVFYSRRQAIRIHDAAILKLVGEEVGA